MTLPSYNSVNELIIHKVPDLSTWINNYGSNKDIKPEDIVVFPPSLIDLSGKQDMLVSGTNIKTINSTSLLGNGDIEVQPKLVSGTNIKTINSTSLLGNGDIEVQPKLVSGTNIKTINSTSLLGNGNIAVQVPLAAGTDYIVPPSSPSNGNVLTYNGTSWIAQAPATELPSQSSSTNGQYLKSNGSTASWASGSTAPQSGSSNLVTAGALYNSVKRTDSIDASNTSYSTKMARAIYATTTDLTAGSSSLTSGVICVVYEQ